MNIAPFSAHFVFYARSSVMLTVALFLYFYANIDVTTYAYLTWAFTAAAFIQYADPIKGPALAQGLLLLKLPWEHPRAHDAVAQTATSAGAKTRWAAHT